MAHNKGYKIFDFGRTSIANEGLMKFKGYWGTIAIDLPQYYYPENVGMKEGENSIGYKFIKKICENAPDSVVRLVGRFCYRHMG